MQLCPVAGSICAYTPDLAVDHLHATNQSHHILRHPADLVTPGNDLDCRLTLMLYGFELQDIARGEKPNSLLPIGMRDACYLKGKSSGRRCTTTGVPSR